MRKFGSAFLRFCRDLLANQTISVALIYVVSVVAGREIIGEPAVFYLAPVVALLALLPPRLIRWERRRRSRGA